MRIDTKRGRDALAPRREPYWQKLSRGRYLGIRKQTSGQAAWIARYRDDEGAQHYSALGEVSESFGFDQAKDANDRASKKPIARKTPAADSYVPSVQIADIVVGMRQIKMPAARA